MFTLMRLALFLVWRQRPVRDVRMALWASVGQFALNPAWTPALFRLQRPDLGLVVIVPLWLAICVTIAAFTCVDRCAAVLLVPYLAWVSFAVLLNYAIHAGW